MNITFWKFKKNFRQTFTAKLKFRMFVKYIYTYTKQIDIDLKDPNFNFADFY